MSAERKYTDRDVRDGGQEIYDKAMAFVEGYTGEFQFLIDCRMVLEMGRPLTVGHVRGILNCMRTDPRVTDLPAPQTWEDNVVDIRPARRKARKWATECTVEGYHEAHRIGNPDGYNQCRGKYAINRGDDFSIRAKINPDFHYIAARTGRLVHLHNDDAWFMWRPRTHEWGWNSYSYDLGAEKADFYVRTKCHFPRIVENGILFSNDHLDDVMAEPYSGTKMRQLCMRCFPNAPDHN